MKLLTTIAAIAVSTALSAAEQTRPNVIVIYTDDQGFGDASCLNPESKFQTPNLDRLAREGISFRRALFRHCLHAVSIRVADGPI